MRTGVFTFEAIPQRTMYRRAFFEALFMFALLESQIVPSSRASPCKLGWTEWNNACYKLFTSMKDVNVATNMCRGEGAYLVSIGSSQENVFVRSLVGNEEIFIGYNDVESEGSFVWSDGSSLTYENWQDSQPDNDAGAEDCVIMDGTDGKWNDTPCDMWYQYVCKLTVAKEKTYAIHINKALVQHVILKQVTPSALHCALLCTNNPSCKALNYKSHAGQKSGSCELNDATAQDFPTHLIWSPHSVYSVPTDVSCIRAVT